MIESVIFIAASMHFAQGDYNQFNPGALVKFDNQLVVGGYKNSFNDVSLIVAKDYRWESQDWEYGFIVGGVTAYDLPWTIGGVTAMVMPYVAYDFDGVKPTLSLVGHAIGFNLEVEF